MRSWTLYLSLTQDSVRTKSHNFYNLVPDAALFSVLFRFLAEEVVLLLFLKIHFYLR